MKKLTYLLLMLFVGVTSMWADDDFSSYRTYFNDFSSTEGLTQIGSGEFITDADANFGQIYHNDPALSKAIRTNYLKLPTSCLDNCATNKEMTIGFWVNKKNAADYFYSPIFTAYGAAPDASTGNTWPMFCCTARGTLQINSWGYCDFGDTYNDKGTNAASTAWSDDGNWHYFTITLTEKTAAVYVDGTVLNSWTVDGTSDGQVISGLFLHPDNTPYICLGGDQAWAWNDPDPAFGFDDFAVYSKALTADQIKQIMSDKTGGSEERSVVKSWDFKSIAKAPDGSAAFDGLTFASATWYGNATYGIWQGNGTRAITISGLKANDLITAVVTGTTGYAVNGTNCTVDASSTGGTGGGNYVFKVTADGDASFSIGRVSANRNEYTYLSSITVTRAGSFCNAPTATITGAAGTTRKFTLACATANSEIYYSESELTTAEGGTKYEGEVTTSAATVYAYAKTDAATSEVMSFETGAGTEVALNAPVANITYMTQAGNLYNPGYTMTSDQSSVLGAPTATISYQINGGDEVAESWVTITKPCTLTVTAKADGYASTSTNVEITNAFFKSTKNFTFDSTLFPEQIGTDTGKDQTINSTGCSCWTIDGNVVDGLTLSNMNLAWAKTKNVAYCLINRLSKSGSVTYNSTLPEGGFIYYTDAYGTGNTTTSTTLTFAQYGTIKTLDVLEPVTETVYTITCNAADNGSMKASQYNALAGTVIKITTSANENYKFASLSVKDADENPVSLIEGTKTFTMPESNVNVYATFKAIEYTEDRAVETGKYGTICLPYDATVEGATIMEMNGRTEYNDGITFNYAENNELKAGVPYLYKATADAQKFTYTKVVDPVEAGVKNFWTGTFKEVNLTDAKYFMYSDNQFHPSNGFVTIQANKCYLNTTSIAAIAEAKTSQNAKAVTFGIYGDATGINAVNFNDVKTVADGKFVKNGAIVIVKNGKKYNAAGAQVK